jgi:hypothetical protein
LSQLEVSPRPADTDARPWRGCVGGAATFVAGETYGEYAVVSIDLAAGAPCGAYTLTVPNPEGDDVEMRRAGAATVIAYAAYDWRTTISATDATMYATLHFAGYFDVAIRKSGSGTINLYDLPLAICDGSKILVVP